MLRGLLYALTVCVLAGAGMEHEATNHHRKLEQLEDQLPVPMTASIVWANCGDWNGLYYGSMDLIVLCNENDVLLSPGAQRVLVLHELGHAYAAEYGLDLTRWGGKAEDQADEFAIVMTLTHGRPEDLLDSAQAWDRYAHTVGVVPGDTHSPATLRAKRLRDAYWGYHMLFGDGYFYFKEMVEFWHQEFLRVTT